ncbi:MAG: FAD-dependent oxidoreductase [Betaproteobacteria bacterium]|nr:FAD-dependent oxidoreductase [Betaproteobacteria bacterium]MBK8918037.1 FAD-dependent oxidoreductase [Betaproteobacteria bacterium]
MFTGSQLRVAVVGAGWAGLAAAVDLVTAGASVTLFEAGRQPGGRARRAATRDGPPLDNGQHLFLGAYRECLALMRRVGAEPEVLFDRRPLRVSDNAGFSLALPRLPAPLNLAWGLLAARGVTAREKLATALWMQGLKARQFVLAADTTVADWLDAAGQTGVLRRRLWEPLCLAALNTPAERASAQVFAHVLRDSLGSPRRADTDLLLPRVPLSAVFPDPAVAWLAARGAELRFGRRVRVLEPDDDQVRVDGEAFAGAVVAVAPQHLAALLPPASPLPALAFEPIATVYLGYDPAVALPFPLMALAGGIGQWVVDRGNGVLAAILSGHGPWEDLPDADLAAEMHREIGLPEPPAWHRTLREQRATFSCRPGLARLPCLTAHRSVVLAGDHTWAEYPATLEGAVRSGRGAAAALDHALRAA